MQRFEFFDTDLRGLTVVKRSPYKDERGFLARIYCQDEFSKRGLDRPLVQINHTLTKAKGTLRGLHYQAPPSAEAKLITCWKGAIFDVAVDVRRDSPTFLRWHGEHLTAENQRSLFIPEGFSHGFQTLTEDCELLYLHSAAYTLYAERGIRPDDPKIGVKWPLPVSLISERDSRFDLLNDNFEGVAL